MRIPSSRLPSALASAGEQLHTAATIRCCKCVTQPDSKKTLCAFPIILTRTGNVLRFTLFDSACAPQTHLSGYRVFTSSFQASLGQSLGTNVQNLQRKSEQQVHIPNYEGDASGVAVFLPASGVTVTFAMKLQLRSPACSGALLPVVRKSRAIGICLQWRDDGSFSIFFSWPAPSAGPGDHTPRSVLGSCSCTQPALWRLRHEREEPLPRETRSQSSCLGSLGSSLKGKMPGCKELQGCD